LLALPGCVDRDPLQPDPRRSPSGSAPILSAASGTTVTEWVSMAAAETTDWEIGGVANLSGDASMDIVWQNRSIRQVAAWEMLRTEKLRSIPVAGTESGDWEIGGAADMTGDGKPDVVWQNRRTLQTGVWVMNGAVYAGWVPLPGVESGDWQIGGVADMTGDGKADVVWQNRATRQTGVWVMNATTYAGWIPMAATESGDWEIGGVADLTGDGKADIVWQNRVTRQTGVWVMDGTTLTGWVAMPLAESLDWKIAAAADMTGDGRPDVVWQNRVTRQTGVWVMGGTASPVAPSEARHKVSYTAFRTPPYGFRAATPWLAVVHTGPQGTASSLEIDYIELWAEIDGVSRAVTSNSYADGVFAGELRDRNPWFGGAWEKMPGAISSGVLVIRPGDRPEKVWHPYLETWPYDRYDLSRATRVWFVTRVRIHGPAAVQAGVDYYEQLGYSGNRLEEGAATDWAYTQGEWITLTTERSTEVAGPIELSAPRADGTYAVGNPITAAFTLLNADDDRIRLDELGIDTRRVISSNPYCEPARGEWTSAFGWAVGVNLAQGASLYHSRQWTPTLAGDYCLRVVEKRAGVSGYQQPYAGSGFRLIRVR
jgi:hypothetical protein